jgi:hypothetical protein
MLSTVMSGFAFSNTVTSSTHSLCWMGFSAAGGAQSMLIVTFPLLELDAEVLEQAEAARLRPATAATAAAMRHPATR